MGDPAVGGQVNFSNDVATANEQLEKAKTVAKRKTWSAAGIHSVWMTAYAATAQRVALDRRYDVTRHPDEAGPSISAFVGVVSDDRDWPYRKSCEYACKSRVRGEVREYGWVLGRISVRTTGTPQEGVSQNKVEEVMRYDVWCVVANRYIIRMLGLRTKFYRMDAEDPSYAKLILPLLEKRGKIPLADVFNEAMHKRESHMKT